VKEKGEKKTTAWKVWLPFLAQGILEHLDPLHQIHLGAINATLLTLQKRNPSLIHEK